MILRIADLITKMQTTGNMNLRCKEYLCTVCDEISIEIRNNLYDISRWPTLSYDQACYMESGEQFYTQLLHHNGLMLHASAVALDNRAYLFSGQCGMGKSTHTRLWQQTFGEGAKVFNDDKPALRRLEDGWFAYGTPWCGKDGINLNMKVPLAGICFLKRGEENRIRRLNPQEAISMVLSQTLNKFHYEATLDLLLSHVNHLVTEIPIYELYNKPEPDAARLSYETMRRGAEEIGL